MNTQNLANVDLDSDVLSTLLDADAQDAPVAEAPNVEGDSAPVEPEVPAEDDEAAAPEVAAASPQNSAPEAPRVRKTAGRKFDATGKTNLGRCRLIYAENTSLAPKALKELFVAKTGISPQVAQTYASIVRKPQRTAKAA